MTNTIKDIAGHNVNVGDVVAYAAKSGDYTQTHLYIVHTIQIHIENRNHHTYDAVTNTEAYEMRPTEIVEVRLRGFQQSWYAQQKGVPVRTYVRTIANPKSLVKIDDLSHLDPNEPIHEAILEWLNNHCLRVGQRPPQHIHK